MFGQKRKINELRKEIVESFDNVKKDFAKVGEWITVLDDKSDKNDKKNSSLDNELANLKKDIETIRANSAFFGQGVSKQVSNSVQTDTTFNSVQTDVQTGVQTDGLYRLTVMERAIVFALLNSELKLSYEDLSSMFGKNKSTVRGQINTIKQKIPGIIGELMEPSGKKRVFIPDKMKDYITKSIKIKIKRAKKH